MERELHLPQLATYLDRVYFASKEPLRRGAQTTKPAALYAEGIFASNTRSRTGYESSLSGYLAEPMFVTLLTYLSPEGITVEPSGKDRDENHGCDIIVKQEGEIIGGFSLKSGQSSYANRKTSRIKEFPVVTVLMEHLGAKELITLLQAGQLPEIDALVRQRLYSLEGNQMREQLRDQMVRQLGSVPQGVFRDYLGQLAFKVANLHRRLQSA